MNVSQLDLVDRHTRCGQAAQTGACGLVRRSSQNSLCGSRCRGILAFPDFGTQLHSRLTVEPKPNPQQATSMAPSKLWHQSTSQDEALASPILNGASKHQQTQIFYSFYQLSSF
jgi:hypothetical protein